MHIIYFLHQGFRELSLDRQTNRQTATTDIIYHAAWPAVIYNGMSVYLK